MYEIMEVTVEWLEDAGSWMPNSKCAKDEELRDWQIANPEDQFFDERTKDATSKANRDPEKVTRAKEYCASCPVRDACLNHALKYNESGIWGGTTELERRQMKRKARKSLLEFLTPEQARLLDMTQKSAS